MGGGGVVRRFMWEGIDVYIYLIHYVHSRNEDNIVKQLYSNKKYSFSLTNKKKDLFETSLVFQ